MSEGTCDPAGFPGYPGRAMIPTAASQRGRSFIPPVLVFSELWLGSRGYRSNHHTLWRHRRFMCYRRQMDGESEPPDQWVDFSNFPKCLQRWPSWIECPVARGSPDQSGQVHFPCFLSLRYQVFRFAPYPAGFVICVFRRLSPWMTFTGQRPSVPRPAFAANDGNCICHLRTPPSSILHLALSPT